MLMPQSVSLPTDRAPTVRELMAAAMAVIVANIELSEHIGPLVMYRNPVMQDLLAAQLLNEAGIATAFLNAPLDETIVTRYTAARQTALTLEMKPLPPKAKAIPRPRKPA